MSKCIILIMAEVMNWIVYTSGCSIDEISLETKIPSEQIRKWTVQDSKIDLKDIELIGNYVQRPIPLFFRANAPIEAKVVDYRENKKITLNSQVLIRKIRYRQHLAKEMMEELNINLEPNIKKNITLNDLPIDIIKKQSNVLKFSHNFDNKQLFEILCNKIETFNIYIFQDEMKGVEINGISLTNELPYVICIKNTDDIKNKIFTIYHEYAHILLQKGGVCLTTKSDKSDVESWCNLFAIESMKKINLKNESPSIDHDYKQDGYQKCIENNGGIFMELVVDSFEKKNITTHDVLTFLDIDSDTLEQVI